jgi:hypothetical protein
MAEDGMIDCPSNDCCVFSMAVKMVGSEESVIVPRILKGFMKPNSSNFKEE